MSRHRAARHRAGPRGLRRVPVVLAVGLSATLIGGGLLGAAPESVRGATTVPTEKDRDERDRYATDPASAFLAGLRPGHGRSDTVEVRRPPADSGQGRRAVYSESRQRVWIVEAGDRVVRTYPVSGSIYDNLDPGTYQVYSRSEQAWGIDDSGTMEWFVRFTQGDNGAAIGFHDIPVKDGVPLQTEDALGTATSHGCIRQAEEDARAMWEFAQLGTTVVVTP